AGVAASLRAAALGAVLGAVLGTALGPALARVAVGVPPAALELHGHRREELLQGSPTGGALGEERVPRLLDLLQGVTALPAPVLVDRHGLVFIGVRAASCE